ncbi:hypothetical protein BC936DRAFT_143291 [Jimgerdemannia flammicorona]|uniref:Uncharacterized protein n=1 Tax=Jimgerdemannia flammicorona TaxID=994334 RepID=A0A432ZZE2_9FUNG|nr:hypothetical protein BC936DRAFT_143291 [Jimgerdemannia flammicorona]
MKLNRKCREALRYPEYWGSIHIPSLESFLRYRQQFQEQTEPQNPVLNKESENLSCQREIDTIRKFHLATSRIYKVMPDALKSLTAPLRIHHRLL